MLLGVIPAIDGDIFGAVRVLVRGGVICGLVECSARLRDWSAGNPIDAPAARHFGHG